METAVTTTIVVTVPKTVHMSKSPNLKPKSFPETDDELSATKDWTTGSSIPKQQPLRNLKIIKVGKALEQARSVVMVLQPITPASSRCFLENPQSDTLPQKGAERATAIPWHKDNIARLSGDESRLCSIARKDAGRRALSAPSTKHTAHKTQKETFSQGCPAAGALIFVSREISIASSDSSTVEGVGILDMG
jgi:hypothetical protein